MPELTLRHLHLDEFTLLRYAAGDLERDENERAAEHLESCIPCSGALKEIQRLDGELRLLAREPDSLKLHESGDLPPGDPFRIRPALVNRPVSGVPDAESLARAALLASERAGALQDQLLNAARDVSILRRWLTTLSLSDPTHRFALLYALQQAGLQIAESPVRMLRLGEETLAMLRRQAPARSAGLDPDAERIVPRLTLLAQSHLLAGQACMWTSEFERAEAHFAVAYRSFARAGWDEVTLAQVEHLESQRRAFTGRGEEALVLARRAAATFEAREMEDALARARQAEGLALFDLGRQEEAVEAYRFALPIFKRRNLWSNYVVALNSIGTSLLKMGRFDEARREYAHALRRLSRDENRPLLAAIRHGLADILFSAGRYREAAMSLSRASRTYSECGLLARSLTASLFEIESWARAGELGRARHRLEIFRVDVARCGALDPSVTQQIADALAGNHPDLEALDGLRQQSEEVLHQRLGGMPA